MAVASLVPTHELSHFASQWGNVLSEAFGGPVDVYHWMDEWCLLVDRGVTSRTHELRDAVFCVPLEQRKPIFSELEDAGHAIIPFDAREGCFLAVATIPNGDADHLKQLARLAQQNLRLQMRLKSEAQKSNADVTPTCSSHAAGGSESGFLAALVDRLATMSPEYDFSDVSNVVLPALSATIKAQSIAIVPKSTSSRNAFVSVGDHVGDLAEWERIVEAHWHPNSESPIYQRVCGVAYSSIRNFVIAPIRLEKNIFGWLVADIDEVDIHTEALTTAVMNASATLLATYAFADERLKQKEQLLLDVVRSLVSAIDAKDPQTCGHSVRVAIYASLVAEGLELTQRECEEVYLSGLLHDVGKIGVPEAIFHKSTSLTEEEFELVKQHPDHGWKILHRLEDLQHILPGVVHHHESYDGTGYPDQIEGEDIPLAARILAAVDAYDALTSERPYRKGKSHVEAMCVLDEGSGVQWDPIVVETLHKVSRRIERVSKKYRREAHPWRIPGSITPQEEVQQNLTGESATDSTIETTSRYDAHGVDRI